MLELAAGRGKTQQGQGGFQESKGLEEESTKLLISGGKKAQLLVLLPDWWEVARRALGFGDFIGFGEEYEEQQEQKIQLLR